MTTLLYNRFAPVGVDETVVVGAAELISRCAFPNSVQCDSVIVLQRLYVAEQQQLQRVASSRVIVYNAPTCITLSSTVVEPSGATKALIR
jgi:hypothetical protein